MSVVYILNVPAVYKSFAKVNCTIHHQNHACAISIPKKYMLVKIKYFFYWPRLRKQQWQGSTQWHHITLLETCHSCSAQVTRRFMDDITTHYWQNTAIHLTLTEEVWMFAANSLFRGQPLQGTSIDICLIKDTDDKPVTRDIQLLRFGIQSHLHTSQWVSR